MSERSRSEIMVLVAGAALGSKPANEITGAQWDDFLDRCEIESSRPAPEETPLDTGFSTAEDPVDDQQSVPEPEDTISEVPGESPISVEETPEEATESPSDSDPSPEDQEGGAESSEDTETLPEG